MKKINNRTVKITKKKKYKKYFNDNEVLNNKRLNSDFFYIMSNDHVTEMFKVLLFGVYILIYAPLIGHNNNNINNINIHTCSSCESF